MNLDFRTYSPGRLALILLLVFLATNSHIVKDLAAESKKPSGLDGIAEFDSAYFQMNSQPAKRLRVAFMGDQGTGVNRTNAKAVLQLIKRESTQLVLHQGDFDYKQRPDKWDALINEVLGKDFPYLASIGNHDVKAWKGNAGYQQKLRQRSERVKGLRCHGDVGVNWTCVYRGLYMVFSGIGTYGEGHVEYLDKSLSSKTAKKSLWHICSWHKNMNKMQLGLKGDETGWQPYEICRKHGAMIATAHEHSYSRTHAMRSFKDQIIASKDKVMQIAPGISFAFVSGMGGHSVRPQERCLKWPKECKYWAAIYTQDQGAKPGALFCDFYVDNKPNKARCYFKDIAGNIGDRFGIISAYSSKPES